MSAKTNRITAVMTRMARINGLEVDVHEGGDNVKDGILSVECFHSAKAKKSRGKNPSPHTHVHIYGKADIGSIAADTVQHLRDFENIECESKMANQAWTLRATA